MSNTEVMLKAQEKRLAGVERTLDTLAKELRGSGIDAATKQISSLEKRIDALETMVKALAASSKAGGGKADTQELTKMLKENEDWTKKTINAHLDEFEKGTKLKELEKQHDLLETTIKTVAAKQEKHVADEIAKQQREIETLTKELKATAQMEGRLGILEAQVKAALAIANAKR
jgi:lambda repressor-like predicted transcriptional regulator